MCVSVCLCVCLCAYVSVCLSVRLSTSLPMSLPLPLSPWDTRAHTLLCNHTRANTFQMLCTHLAQVLDEADRMLTLEFENEINAIMANVPKKRTNFLFSATSSDKVKHLMHTVLKNPVHIKIRHKVKTVDTLHQFCVFVPLKFKTTYLVWFLQKQDLNEASSVIIFAETKRTTMKSVFHHQLPLHLCLRLCVCACVVVFLHPFTFSPHKHKHNHLFCSACCRNRLLLILRKLGLKATCLHGNMTQEKRIGALTRFKAHKEKCAPLVATPIFPPLFAPTALPSHCTLHSCS